VKEGKDTIGVGVGAIIVNEDGEVFMARRGKKATNERGMWEFPGGKVEFGEKLKDAVRREIKEEFDIEIEVIDLLDVVDHILPDEGQHWVSPSYVCRLVAGEPRIVEPDKCDEICWYRIDALPENITKATEVNAGDYREYLSEHNGKQ
jgi:8-oxo-dGTP diphosphatase